MDAVDGMIGDSFEYMAQIVFRIDAVQFGRAEQSVDRSRTFSAGEAVAFAAENVISCTLMATILTFTASPRLIRFTGLAIGGLVAFGSLLKRLYPEQA